VPRPRRKPRSGAKRRQAKGTPRRSRLLSFFASPVLRRVLLVFAVVGLGYLFASPLVGLGVAAWGGSLEWCGAGLIILAAALGVLIWVVWRGFSVLIRRWNWFLGGALLALALWGTLSFFSPRGSILWEVTLGGRFGRSIVGTADLVGALRVAGLALVGLIFVTPRRLWRSLGAALRGGRHAVVRAPQPRPQAAPPRSVSPQAPLPEVAPARERSGLAGLIPSRAVPVAPATVEAPAVEQQEPTPWRSRREPILTAGGWQLPPIDILDRPTELELNKEDVEKRARLIEESLESYGVDAKVVEMNIGPTVTQFGVEPGWDRKYRKVLERGEERLEEVSRTRIRVERIASLANDLALALAAPSIRIEAPVPGKSLVGIEVPNMAFGSVAIRSVIETAAFQKLKARSKIAIALGKGAGGEAVAADLARMPHLLVAGATGSGKTVCLDSVICCLLVHNSPDDVRLIMVDPKRVELVAFNGLPHLATPVVVDTDKAVKVLRWLDQEMDRRYHRFAETGVRNIEAYNKDRAPGEGMAYLVLVIDELADLMMAAFDEVEHALCRLAQLARATGIHLIVATQRPSVDVVTGLIKANFPSRISFAVTSQVDSRTILDTVGAEKLLGRGDMLYMPSEAGRPKRLQGAFVSDVEIERLVHFWGTQRELQPSAIDFDELAERVALSQRLSSVPDPLLDEARRLAQEHTHVSTSFLQRRLRIGYPRAARLMETLEQEGVEEGRRSREES
jgi:S-DNA-T family DNA segregation ATPase FtsK/SpoIIIE